MPFALTIREATTGDHPEVRALVREAFACNEPDETVRFLDDLRTDTCIIGEWVAERNCEGLLADIVLSRVWIEMQNRERVPVCMLTPLAVSPAHQRQGIGTRLMTHALQELERRGEHVALVLGHPDYYPRMGFRADRARSIVSPWGDNPAFMARGAPIPAGRLVLPRSIAAAH